MGKIAILAPVWPSYQWLAPILLWTLDKFWTSHPPIWFCGMTADEANDLPILPWSGGDDRTNWTRLLQDGARQLAAKDVTYVYVIAEEHLPLAPCHLEHLDQTLPRLMEELPAVYISLMGWDNRRYPSKSPILDPAHYRLRHLIAPRDPRFNLHPALWRIDALQACCEAALENEALNGSAWHFEKVNARQPQSHAKEWARQCYQISAEAMTTNPPSGIKQTQARMSRFLYHKLMALIPLLPNQRIANAYFKAMRFENVYCDGPYPLFFSGIMSKGGFNPYALNFLKKSAQGREVLKKIESPY